MKTRYGNAKIYNDYYIITSRKEGNHSKFLHRLIWEDFWRTEVPEGYVIHHRDHNHLNNCILNLQLMRWEDHSILHIGDQKGKNNLNYKPYATVIKKGFNSSGKQRYGIYFNGKEMWAMPDKKKLIDRFCAEYPFEIIKKI